MFWGPGAVRENDVQPGGKAGRRCARPDHTVEGGQSKEGGATPLTLSPSFGSENSRIGTLTGSRVGRRAGCAPQARGLGPHPLVRFCVLTAALGSTPRHLHVFAEWINSFLDYFCTVWISQTALRYLQCRPTQWDEAAAFCFLFVCMWLSLDVKLGVGTLTKVCYSNNWEPLLS